MDIERPKAKWMFRMLLILGRASLIVLEVLPNPLANHVGYEALKRTDYRIVLSLTQLCPTLSKTLFSLKIRLHSMKTDLFPDLKFTLKLCRKMNYTTHTPCHRQLSVNHQHTASSAYAWQCQKQGRVSVMQS